MANPEHLAELRKGVKHWNAWVEEQGPDFKADLVGAEFGRANLVKAKLRGANLEAANLEAADLGGANLEGASLRIANLTRADLGNANLTKADLNGTILKAANLGGPNIGRADLKDANLSAADLGAVDARTLVLLASRESKTVPAEYADLSKTRNLTQSQLDSMDGDSGTIIPDHLTRPDHWPVVEGHLNGKYIGPETEQHIPPNPGTSAALQSIDAPTSATQRVVYLLQHARRTELTAEATAIHLEFEANTLRQQRNDIGPEVDLMDEMVETLRAIASHARSPSPNVQTFQERIIDLEKQVQELTASLNDALAKNGVFSDTFKKTSAALLATAVVGGPLWMIHGGLTYLMDAGSQATLEEFFKAAAKTGLSCWK